MAARPGSLLGFPDPVNEVSARLVAGGVVLLAVAAIATDTEWLTLVLAYGFLARVLTGPRLSPLGQLVTRVITPRLRVEPKLVPGPPKRFAQSIGVIFSGSALLLALVFEQHAAAALVLGGLCVAAGLESLFGYCLGCKVFQLGMRLGLVPEDVCVECANIWARDRSAAGVRA